MRSALPLAATLLCALAAGCSAATPSDRSALGSGRTERTLRAAALTTPSAVATVDPAVAATASPTRTPTVAARKTCALPSSSIFRADVSRLPLNSAASGWQLNLASNVHPDFGSGA